MTEKETFSVQLEDHERYRNITDEIQSIVQKLHIASGVVYVSVPHTTCTLLLQEDEPCLIEKDLFAFLDRMIPPPSEEISYVHDSNERTVNPDPDRPERVNGHAHLRASFLNPDGSVQIDVEEGKLALGQWQQILFFDFDDLEEWRERTVVVRNAPTSYDSDKYALN